MIDRHLRLGRWRLRSICAAAHPAHAKHLPGGPTMIVQNMLGARGNQGGQLSSTRSRRTTAPSSAACSATRASRNSTTQQRQHPIRRAQVHWLGSTQQEVGFFLSTKTGVKRSTISRTRSHRLVHGAELAELDLRAHPECSIGTNKPIEGYDGSQALLAIERGEVDGHISGGTSAAFRARYRAVGESGDVASSCSSGWSATDFPTCRRRSSSRPTRPSAVRDRLRRAGHGPALRDSAGSSARPRSRRCERPSTKP